MMQLLQTMMADREVERAERQANITVSEIAQNNQGHGNHEHPGSKLKNFQHTNPPIFNKTEEPLDADDWLQTMENNLEVAGVEASEKVLFATHYLSGPARAWWTSARAMNAGQMMTWEDFKLKFSKYHVPQGLIKKMRDEFRELKQGRMSVVEYRDSPAVAWHGIIMPSSSLVPSGLHLHVLDIPLPLLDQPVPSFDQGNACTRQHRRAQNAPATPCRAWSPRQSAPGHHLAPSTQCSPRPLLSPAASPRRRYLTDNAAWTRSPVAVVTDATVRPR
ncbi:hypothetical protein QYE76_034212 [Lolium multiflorum]|uniref:Retrotransposon gag domain-containing protein n=1 Tax=Lolium multiflorum TaxID=4521 RepID=A0AAD8QZ62_LOLMU|nr:hypothetical protein QYE76_034212 [Lolium multiflorum]